jgi:hypothetical protein
MGRTTTYGSRVAFAMDQGSLVRNGGRQVDWNYINDVYRSTAATVTMAAAAAAGATSLTVEALPVAVQAGTILNFGTLAPVTVTVNDASISAGDTVFTVTALSGPIPAGTFLNFTGGTNAQVAQLSADAAAAATTLTVYPLDGTIANTQTATFPGGTMQARVTANAAEAATALTVDELQFAIADDLTATLGGTGVRSILSGTVMCALTSGKVVPRSIRPGSETAIGLIETDAVENDRAASLTGYGIVIGGAVFENLLPDAGGGTTINSTYKTELQTAGVGTGFAFYQYADDSAA